MRILIGEGWEAMFERLSYNGAIGLFYDSTGGGILAYLLAGFIILMAVIGLIATIKWIITRPSKKKAKAERPSYKKTGMYP